MADEGDERSRRRGREGLARGLGSHHTSHGTDGVNGGSRGGHDDWHESELDGAADEGVGAMDNASSGRHHVSRSSVQGARQSHGPLRTTTNRSIENLTDFHKLLMYACYAIWPNATPDNVREFIYHATGGERMYSREEILKHENDVKSKRDRVFAKVHPSFTPENIRRSWRFRTHPPPLGIHGVPRRRFIDIGEFGMELTRRSDEYGRGHSAIRVRKPGCYSRETKITVLIAIEPGDPNVPDHLLGSAAKPRVWNRIFYQAGINQLDFLDFLDEICTNLEEFPAPSGCDEHRVFIWDDRPARVTSLVYDLVESRESQNVFFIVRRPPDQSIYAPTQCSILEMVQQIQRNVLSTWTTDDMVHNIHQVLTTGFGWHGASQRRFQHCGYRFDGN